MQDDLLRYEAFGVIMRVPYGEPVTWRHRVMVMRKRDEAPRRSAHLLPLNKHSKRETFSTKHHFNYHAKSIKAVGKRSQMPGTVTTV